MRQRSAQHWPGQDILRSPEVIRLSGDLVQVRESFEIYTSFNCIVDEMSYKSVYFECSFKKDHLYKKIDSMPRIIEFDESTMISKAQRVFWKKGYNATSMKDLEKATGLNPGSIYNTFGNKHELFLLCLKDYLVPISAFDLSNDDKPKGAYHRLQSYFLEIVTNTVINGDSCFSSKTCFELAGEDQSIHEVLKESMDKLLAIFEKMISDAQKEGVIREELNAEYMAQIMVSALPGFGQNYILYKDKNRISNIIENFLNLFRE